MTTTSGTGRIPSDLAAVGQEPPVCFLGRRTLSKLYLMLHLGRMLGAAGLVRMDTVNPNASEEMAYTYNGIEMREHPNPAQLLESVSQIRHGEGGMAEDRTGQARESTPRWHFIDMAENMALPSMNRLVLVLDPDRNSLETGLATLAEMVGREPDLLIHRVYLDLLRTSRVGAAYMEGMLKRHVSQGGRLGEWFALEAHEQDQGAILDNQHDDRLCLGRLSSSYKLLLKELAMLLFGLPAGECARLMRAVNRKERRGNRPFPQTGR